MKTKRNSSGFLRAIEPEGRADGQEQDHRTDQEQIDQIAVPRAVAGQDRVSELVILADRELIGWCATFQGRRRERRGRRNREAARRRCRAEVRASPCRIASQRFNAHDQPRGRRKQRTRFLSSGPDRQRAEDVGGEARPVARRAQVFPEHPESKKRPKSKEAVDERVLRHVDLRRRESSSAPRRPRPTRALSNARRKPWKAAASGC